MLSYRLMCHMRNIRISLNNLMKSHSLGPSLKQTASFSSHPITGAECFNAGISRLHQTLQMLCWLLHLWHVTDTGSDLVTVNALMQTTYLVDFRELDSLLQCAAPTDGGNVEHSIPELNECSPAGGKGCMVKGHTHFHLTEAETRTWYWLAVYKNTFSFIPTEATRGTFDLLQRVSVDE